MVGSGIVGWYYPEITTTSDVSDLGAISPLHTRVRRLCWSGRDFQGGVSPCKRFANAAPVEPTSDVCPASASRMSLPKLSSPVATGASRVDTVGTPGVIGDKERRDSLRRLLRFSCCLAPQSRDTERSLCASPEDTVRPSPRRRHWPNGLGPIRGMLRYSEGLGGGPPG